MEWCGGKDTSVQMPDMGRNKTTSTGQKQMERYSHNTKAVKIM